MPNINGSSQIRAAVVNKSYTNYVYSTRYVRMTKAAFDAAVDDTGANPETKPIFISFGTVSGGSRKLPRGIELTPFGVKNGSNVGTFNYQIFLVKYGIGSNTQNLSTIDVELIKFGSGGITLGAITGSDNLACVNTAEYFASAVTITLEDIAVILEGAYGSNGTEVFPNTATDVANKIIIPDLCGAAGLLIEAKTSDTNMGCNFLYELID